MCLGSAKIPDLEDCIHRDNAAQETASDLAAQVMREEAAGQLTALRTDFESRVRELSEEYERRTQV